METQFNLNVKVDIAIDNGTQQFVRDIVSAVSNRSNNPVTTTEIPQPTPVVEGKKPRKRNVTLKVEEEKPIAEEEEKPTAEEEKPTAEEEKPTAEEEKPTAEEEEEKQPQFSKEDISKMIKSMGAKAKKLGDDVAKNLKISLVETLVKFEVKQVKDLKESDNDKFMQSLYTMDAQLDELAEKQQPTEEKSEHITFDQLSELFRPVMVTYRQEIKDKLEALGAKNLAQLAKEKYGDMKAYLEELNAKKVEEESK